MRLQRLLLFLLTSISAGLAAAVIVLLLNPQLFSEPDPLAPSEPARAPAAASQAAGFGPVSYADAVARAAPSVVNIYTRKLRVEQNPHADNPLFKYFFGEGAGQPRQRLETSLGSGVIVTRNGYILTNNHVVADADSIRVVLASGRSIGARVIGTDADTDLAVLQADADDLPVIPRGRSGPLRVGDVVLAIGNPFGVGQTVTLGIVSATGRSQLGINTFENFIQTDAAINPGNSGGALINAHGELVGINTAIFSRSGGSQGIGFAIPVDLARGVMKQLATTGRVVRGWLGIAGQDVTPQLAESFGLKETRGVLVSGTLEGGPADKAGLQPGDIITRIDDNAPDSAFDILNLVASQPPGTRVRIRGWRGNDELDVMATITERPADAGKR